MDPLLFHFDTLTIILVFMVALFAGIVKGIVGFAMPTILISGLSMVISPDLALAGLLLPTLFTNGVQALGQGINAARASLIKFKGFLIVGAIFLLASSQLVPLIPMDMMFGYLGVLVVTLSLIQMSGWQIPVGKGRLGTIVMGAIAGFTGGLSGVWGPPTVAYLTALNTEKSEQIRVQGVIYGLGAVLLVLAHVTSGILTKSTAIFSASLLGPALVGLYVGSRIRNRIDQRRFKLATLAVLFIAGCNLIRRAWFA